MILWKGGIVVDIDPGMGKEMDSVSPSAHGYLQLLANALKWTAIVFSIEFLEADSLTYKSELCVGIQRKQQSRALLLLKR